MKNEDPRELLSHYPAGTFSKEGTLEIIKASGALDKSLMCCGRKMVEQFRNLIHETNNGKLRIYNVVYICLKCGRFTGVDE